MTEVRLSCGTPEETLQCYLDGALSGSQTREFESHLARCAVCSRELNSFMRLTARLSRLPLFAPGPDFDRLVLAAVLPARRRVLGLSPVAWFACGYLTFTMALLAAALVLSGAAPTGLRLKPATQLWHDALHMALDGIARLEASWGALRHITGGLASMAAAQVQLAARLAGIICATPEGRFYLALSACTALAFFLLAKRSPKGGPIVTAAI